RQGDPEAERDHTQGERRNPEPRDARPQPGEPQGSIEEEQCLRNVAQQIDPEPAGHGLHSRRPFVEDAPPPAYQRRATVTANPSEPSVPWADSRRTCRRMPRWLQQRCPEGPGSLNQSFASYPFTSFRERLEKHVVQPASGASSRRGHREGFLQEAEGGGQPEGRRQPSPACPD